MASVSRRIARAGIVRRREPWEHHAFDSSAYIDKLLSVSRAAASRTRVDVEPLLPITNDLVWLASESGADRIFMQVSLDMVRRAEPLGSHVELFGRHWRILPL